jgi:sugar/nucleoside kinase (ribokinase family)
VADELDGDAREIAPAAGSVFIAQGECDLMATAAALSCAHELGFYTIFNPAPACDLPAGAWPAVDLVCPNETECQVLTGILPADDASCVAALNALLAKGAGAGSVTLADDGEPLRMPALSSTLVDTTAAGDTFIGALAAARLEGLPLFECMAAGARASAVTVSRLGAQQSIPTRAEVERVFDLDDLVQDGEAE